MTVKSISSSFMKYIKGKDYCTNFPDGLFGTKFELACFLHDAAYQHSYVGKGNGLPHTRLSADNMLFSLVVQAYIKDAKYWIGIIVGTVMWTGVRLFGSKYWVER